MFILLGYCALPFLILALFYVAFSQTAEVILVIRRRQPASKEGFLWRVCFILAGVFFMCSIADSCLQINQSAFVVALVRLGLALSISGICLNKVVLPIYLHIVGK